MVSSYIPLYRKYRPQKFADVVGQEVIVKTLSNAIELNKVAHAYLLTGPRGTGKTSTARILAKSLNCKNGPTVDPCGECSSCIDITNGNAIDVIEIDAASNRKVEDARNLLEKVQFVPVSGKFKIYIIDEVHMLTTEAFNTLLKTLEEPPENLVFILATTEAHKVLNTIISRCQRFDFRRIKQDLIKDRLKKIAEIEGLKITDQALSLIARRVSGGLRDALGLLDQVSVLSTLQQEITDKDILTLLGSISEDKLYEITNTIADKNSDNLISVLDDIIQLGNEPVQLIRELITYFRNLMVIKTTNNIEEIKTLIDASEQFYKELQDQSQKFEITEIAQIIEKLSGYEKTIKQTSQQHLWLEISLISICHRHDIQVIKDLESRIIKLEEMILSGGVVPAQIKPVSNTIERIKLPPKQEVVVPKSEAVAPISTSVTEEKSTVNISQPISTPDVKESSEQIASIVSNISSLSGDVNQDWIILLEKIDNIPTRSFFKSLAKPVEITPDKVIITFTNESFVKQCQEKGKITPLEKAAEKLFGSAPRITVRTPFPEDEKVRAQSRKSPSEVKTDPVKVTKKENFEQITQEFAELPKKAAPKVAVAEEPLEPLDDEIINQIDNIDNPVTPINLSEQAKMIVDLFQGKVIE